MHTEKLSAADFALYGDELHTQTFVILKALQLAEEGSETTPRMILDEFIEMGIKYDVPGLEKDEGEKRLAEINAQRAGTRKAIRRWTQRLDTKLSKFDVHKKFAEMACATYDDAYEQLRRKGRVSADECECPRGANCPAKKAQKASASSAMNKSPGEGAKKKLCNYIKE